VLRGPSPRGPRAVVIRPHHLVEEARAPEDLVEQHLAVMRLPRIDVEVQGALGGEDSSGLLEARTKPADVVVEAVVVASSLLAFNAIAASGKPQARRGCIGGRGGSHPASRTPGVERRIDVDESRAPIRQRAQHLERLPLNDRRCDDRRVGAESLRSHVE
jgi:hypothetical protein